MSSKTTPELHAMAKALADHPDYRVLRRMIPLACFSGPTLGYPPKRILIVDAETTGLSSEQDRIIEVGILVVDVETATGLPISLVAEYSSFEDPGREILPQIQALTGITNDMVHGQKFDDALICGLAQQADLVIAHNAAFDRPFFESRFPCFKGNRWACSFAEIDWKSEGIGSSKLEFIASAMGFFYDAHRATTDCHALYQILDRQLSDGVTGFARLMNSADNPAQVISVSAFARKDELKQRSYRWNGLKKTWDKSFKSSPDAELEQAWLESTGLSWRVSSVDSRLAYSGRQMDTLE